MNNVISVSWDVIRTLFLIGVIILIHELGHFLSAKRLGIKVERFSIGFGPKLAAFKKGDTEYRISWLPIFGGYVKMAGENPSDQRTDEEGQFYSAPVSHRALVAISGPGMNILFAVFAIAIAYMIGLAPQVGTEIGYVEPNSPASEAGIIEGDKIVSVNGYKVKKWDDIRENVGINPGKELEVTLIRDGSKEITVNVTPELIEGTEFGKIGVSPPCELIISSVEPDSVAEKAGFQPGDVIQAVDDKKVDHIIELYYEMEAGLGKEIRLTIARNTGQAEVPIDLRKSLFSTKSDIGDDLDKNIIPKGLKKEFEDKGVPLSENASVSIREEGAIWNITDGMQIYTIVKSENDRFQVYNLDELFMPILAGLTFEYQKPVSLNPIEAFKKAVPETIRTGGKIFLFLKRLITREVSPRFVSGPIGIIQITMQVVKTGLAGVLWFAGFLSVNLGIVNLLPLFITDGGVLVFLLIEKLRNKPLSQERQIFIQQVGIGFIILLFLLVTYNDILRWVRSAL